MVISGVDAACASCAGVSVSGNVAANQHGRHWSWGSGNTIVVVAVVVVVGGVVFSGIVIVVVVVTVVGVVVVVVVVVTGVHCFGDVKRSQTQPTVPYLFQTFG